MSNLKSARKGGLDALRLESLRKGGLDALWMSSSEKVGFVLSCFGGRVIHIFLEHEISSRESRQFWTNLSPPKGWAWCSDVSESSYPYTELAPRAHVAFQPSY